MPFAICHWAELRTRRSAAATAACVLACLLFLLTSCPGNGGADNGGGETYGGSSGSSSSSFNSSGSSGSGGSHTVSFSFDEFMRLSNSGDTAALEAMFRDDSASSAGGENGEYGVDPLVISADDLGVPAGGTVTLSITGGDEDYEETVEAGDDGMVCFHVPRQRVGSEITVSLVVKKDDGTVAFSGKKTLVVKAGCQFSIALSPEDFVQVGSLLVCIHEVTQGEYETYCSYGSSSPDSTYGVGPDFPAYYVNWYDALVYCNLRSRAEGLTPCYSIGGSTDPADWGPVPASSNAAWSAADCNSSADGYRLPTEAEWEYAAKGGPANDSYTYSGSNTVGDVAWYADNSGTGGGSYTSGGKTHEVKTKAPNSAGIYDMSGNVWEWCWDKYSGSPSLRVWRGGSWGVSASYCAVSYRGDNTPDDRGSLLGFRVVRNAD